MSYEWKPWTDGKYWDLDKPREHRMSRCYDKLTFEQLKEAYKSETIEMLSANNSVARYSVGNSQMDIYEAMLERIYEGEASEDRLKARALLKPIMEKLEDEISVNYHQLKARH